MDNFLNSKKFIVLMVLLIVCLGVFGCGVKTIKTELPKGEESKQPTTLETIGKLEGIAFVLGCMFDPTPCQEKKELENTEEKNND